MPKNSKQTPAPVLVGKGSITPIQIAFIVDNYLARNNFTATLSAFRHEAQHLFSKTNSIQVPKGLLGLADILEDYVSLKEQRLFVDRERCRLESALLGMQDVIDAYHAALPITVSATPTCPPPQLATLTSTDNALNVTSSSLSEKTPIVIPHISADGSVVATPENNSSCTKKRQVLDCTPNAPLAPKKQRSATVPKSTRIGELPSEVTSVTRNEDDARASVTDLTSTDVGSKSIMEGSYVAKSLFKQPSHCLINDASMLPNITSSSHSIVASETLLESPAKYSDYYERNFTSPSEVANSVNKREHVRGKLDFNNANIPASLEERVAAKSSNLLASGGMVDTFDFPELDFLSGDISFSEFLADIDLDTNGDPAEQLTHSPSSERCNRNEGNGHSETNNFVSYSSLSIAKKLSGSITIQGEDTVTSVRSFTKRIKLVNPAKQKPSLHSQKISAEDDASEGNNFLKALLSK